MKISTKTRYAMRFMLDLAKHYGEGSIPMKDIAERQKISKKYLEQVVSPLNGAGLLTVTRGQRGGFCLSRAPEEITLADVVAASEDGLELLNCLGCAAVCEREAGCSSRLIWGGMQNAMNSYLEGMTLASVLEQVEDDTSC